MMRGSANTVSSAILLATAAAAAAVAIFGESGYAAAGIGLGGWALSLSPRQMEQWEQGVLLRLGRFQRVLQPGISWVVPFVDHIVDKVDMRVRSTSFSAEKTLTQDTVPVNVDAVLFWVVTEAKKAILEVDNYQQIVSWAAQTTLRDVIGQTELTRMISDRATIDASLQQIIDHKTSDWGITVQSVEIRDVRIPGGLEDAMSRKAQADREKEARVILAESELLVAEQMHEAAKVYHSDPIALQIRAMNMTYESIKERGALMVVPSDMVRSLEPGAMLGMAAAGFERRANGEGEV